MSWMTSAKLRTRTDPTVGVSWKPGVVAAAAPRETVYAPKPPNLDADSEISLAMWGASHADGATAELGPAHIFQP